MWSGQKHCLQYPTEHCNMSPADGQGRVGNNVYLTEKKKQTKKKHTDQISDISDSIVHLSKWNANLEPQDVNLAIKHKPHVNLNAENI